MAPNRSTPHGAGAAEHLGCLVTVSTPCTQFVGRLVDLDVRIGVTLELSSVASDGSQEALPSIRCQASSDMTCP